MISGASETQTPFARLGGSAGIGRIVDRFYDLMDTDPAYQELRALHAPDLGPMRQSLSGFLTAWVGGPRDWFTENPGKCMMSVHAPIPINAATADQWARAMSEAIRICDVDTELAAKINEAFAAMTSSMARRD